MMQQPGDEAWGWPGPRTSLESVYIEQLHDDDEIHALCRAHHIHLAQSIEEALTLGGDDLAVDGVMLIGEHGEYPYNEIGQKLYPRKEMFDRIVAVYQRCGGTLPMFCDKHFSWNFQWAREMVETAQRMGFMLFGGSSLPHCALAPPLPAPEHAPPRQIVAAFAENAESYGFHSMELIQSYVERRPGGETGVDRVTVYQGPAVMQAMERGEWSTALYQAAVRVAGSAPEDVSPRLAAVVDYADGLRAVHLNIQPGLRGWSLAVQCANDPAPHAARCVLGDDAPRGHFARLARVIEDALVSGEAPFPIERTLLATGVIAAAMRAGAQAGTPLQTPELAIPYAPHQPKHPSDAAPDATSAT